MKMSNETYLLKQFNVVFHRYVDTWENKSKRRITLALLIVPEEHTETIVESLENLGFKQGKRNPRKKSGKRKQKQKRVEPSI